MSSAPSITPLIRKTLANLNNFMPTIEKQGDSKPEYEMRISVFDVTSGEEVETGSAFISNDKQVGKPVFGLENLSEEAAEMAFWKVMRHFRNGGQQNMS
jgi:hypothetical protein